LVRTSERRRRRSDASAAAISATRGFDPPTGQVLGNGDRREAEILQATDVVLPRRDRSVE